MRKLWAASAAIMTCLASGGMPAAGQESAAEPTAWSEATVEILSDVGVIPLEAIPADADHVTYARISVEPGISGGGVGSQPQAWSNLDYIYLGSISDTAETDRRTWRADGTVEDTPAGTPLRSNARDTVLSWNGAAAGQWENAGPGEFVSFFLGAGNSRDPEVEPVLVPGLEWRHLELHLPAPRDRRCLVQRPHHGLVRTDHVGAGCPARARSGRGAHALVHLARERQAAGW